MFGMANPVLLQQWPVWIGAAILVIAALLNHRSGRVPNPLTFGAIGAAWVVAALFGRDPSTGGLSSSVICTFVALGAMLTAYGIGCVPAGCVKAQMAFGAWVGCALSLGHALSTTVIVTLAAQLLTAAAISVQLLRRRAPSAGIAAGDAAPRAGELFPIQSTLTVGSLCGLAAIIVLGWFA